jgi:hypothetical protein
MLFPIRVGEKLDLSKFRKQATHYIDLMREITYHVYLPNYKVIVEIVLAEKTTKHLVTMWIVEIFLDQDKEIKNEKVILPLNDMRFKENKDIQSIFEMDNYKAYFNSSSAADTTDKICRIVKLVHKINHLKAFL